MKWFNYKDFEGYLSILNRGDLFNNQIVNKVIFKNHCVICGKEIEENKEFCEDCENNIQHCDICNKSIINDNIKIIKNKKYCLDCFQREFFICYGCHKVFTMNKKHIARDLPYCKHCFDLRFFKCKECGMVIDLHEQNSDCKNYCRQCRPENIILDYRYKPNHYKFKTTRKTDKIFMGVELEITGASNDNTLINIIKQYKNYNDFYFKKDGSIRGRGFEIVSHPYTLLYHKNKALWKQLFETLNDYHINQTDNCGLHVHFPRNIFSTDNIAALDCFVNMNNELIPKLSGRNFNSYCYNSMKQINDWGKNNSDRYQSVNLTNRDTIELRFCKSTGNYDEFIKRLQFLHSIVKFIIKYNITARDIYDYRKKVENKYIAFAKKYYDFLN